LASNLPERPAALRVADQPDHPAVRAGSLGETHVVNDPFNDRRTRDLATQRNFQMKFMSVPILLENKPLGALTFGRELDRPDLTERDVETGRSIASLAALAVENRRLFDQTRRALEDLDELNRHLTGQAWSVYSRQLTPEGVVWVGQSDADHAPEVSEALARGEITVRARDGGQLGVAIPILLRGAPIGAMRLSLPERVWNREMVTMLESIASHVGQAVETARLIETAESRAHRERALSESTDKIRRSTNMERILQAAAEELARHLGAARVAVRVGLDAESTNGGGDHEPAG
jgi:GAF domain-containing protein